MNRAVRAALSLALVFGAAAQVARADNSALRKALDKQYAAFDRALRRKDAKAIEAMATPDFTMREMGRTMNAQQAMAALKQQMAMTKSVKKNTWRILKLDAKGKQAVATVDGAMTIVATTPDHKDHVMDMAATSRDLWVSTAAGWKMKSSTVLKEKLLMDGKPFNPSAMGAPPPSGGPQRRGK